MNTRQLATAITVIIGIIGFWPRTAIQVVSGAPHVAAVAAAVAVPALALILTGLAAASGVLLWKATREFAASRYRLAWVAAR